MATETITRLRINLKDIRPAIWRLVDMPTTGSVEMIHEAIQAAMS